MSHKIAIVILSDPKTNSEESLGRLFNGLATAFECKKEGDDVSIVFQGAGTRWPELISEPDHPAHGLFKAVSDKIAGASCGCAALFEATAGVESCGMPLLTDNAIDGTPGIASIRNLVVAGNTVLTF